MCPEPSNGVLHADGADATSSKDFVKIDEQGSHPAAESREWIRDCILDTYNLHTFLMYHMLKLSSLHRPWLLLYNREKSTEWRGQESNQEHYSSQLQLFLEQHFELLYY
jgi:hypothetical protein